MENASSFGLPGALRELFEVVRLGIYFGHIGKTGSATSAVNPHLKLMLGLPLETPATAVRPFDPDALPDAQARAALLDRLTRDGQASDLRLRLHRADGNPLWVEITANASPCDENGTLSVAAVLRDVTERKRLDDQNRELHQQLLQAERLTALGQTISGVAHELNNPLATILASAERLVSLPGEPAFQRGLETIRGEANRAARIVRNLLTFARRRHTTRTLVDVNQIVRDTLALRHYEQRLSNITVIDALAAGLPAVFADSHQVQQVLLNLVINAEQAMIGSHGRGTLVIRTWQDTDRDAVLVEVSDDGPGIPKEVGVKIFDPFYTTKAAGEGTGLGLTVACAIVEDHGGQLRVGQATIGGAAFVVELPTSSGHKVAGAHAPVAEEPPVEVGSGLSVLIVEDETALAGAVADGLRDAGFEVELADDGIVALKRVQAHPFDVIVCDLRMPRMDGPTFYRAMASTAPALCRRVIFVTGDVAGSEAGRFLEDSGCRWLPKPFRLADLVRVAREVAG